MHTVKGANKTKLQTNLKGFQSKQSRINTMNLSEGKSRRQKANVLRERLLRDERFTGLENVS